ncbi:PDZ domain-containing protein [Schlesneria paludicola]|uniref:PDZ domain-containing protein n=1 Tax=Schlesneria paludicola TaxID=360056 RepID=UPI00029B2903|nr:PDZ domain-containing protein [Schlesneria paludicola]
MLALKSLVSLTLLASSSVAPEDAPPADALYPESIRSAITRLDESDFRQREEAVDELYTAGFTAIPALKEAADKGSPEVSVRAVDILLRLYQIEDESTFETIEQVFTQLKHVENLSTTGRAERAFDTVSELRQKRALLKFEQLGGMVQFAEPNLDRQTSGRPRIEYVMLGRDWLGGDAGLQLLGRIEDIRLADMPSLYIIRGVDISDATLLNLKAELPNLTINRRGPAQLGVTSIGRDGGCIIKAVVPGSAAERAGLRMFDQILKIDQRSVESFDELVEIIGEKEPGDQVPLVFRRGAEIHNSVAELSGWKPAQSKQVPTKIPQK